MKLIHETSPDRALDILNSGVFLASQLPGDEGLNAVFADGIVFVDPDAQSKEKGAFLDMEWIGPEEKGRPEQYTANTLYKEDTRIFIPSGSTQHLVLTNIWFRTGYGWAKAITKPAFPAFFFLKPCDLQAWAQSLAPDWLEQQVALLDARVQHLEIKPLPLVVMPGNEFW